MDKNGCEACLCIIVFGIVCRNVPYSQVDFPIVSRLIIPLSLRYCHHCQLYRLFVVFVVIIIVSKRDVRGGAWREGVAKLSLIHI